MQQYDLQQYMDQQYWLGYSQAASDFMALAITGTHVLVTVGLVVAVWRLYKRK